jgi:hypothetical protein
LQETGDESRSERRRKTWEEICKGREKNCGGNLTEQGEEEIVKKFGGERRRKKKNCSRGLTEQGDDEIVKKFGGERKRTVVKV